VLVLVLVTLAAVLVEAAALELTPQRVASGGVDHADQRYQETVVGGFGDGTVQGGVLHLELLEVGGVLAPVEAVLCCSGAE
jgi:hypothetical protein